MISTYFSPQSKTCMRRPYACDKKILYLSNLSLKAPISRLKKSNLTLKTPTLSLKLPSPET